MASQQVSVQDRYLGLLFCASPSPSLLSAQPILHLLSCSIISWLTSSYHFVLISIPSVC